MEGDRNRKWLHLGIVPSCLGFRVWGSRFNGLGFTGSRVWGLGFQVWGSRFRAEDFEYNFISRMFSGRKGHDPWIGFWVYWFGGVRYDPEFAFLKLQGKDVS